MVKCIMKGKVCDTREIGEGSLPAITTRVYFSDSLNVDEDDFVFCGDACAHARSHSRSVGDKVLPEHYVKDKHLYEVKRPLEVELEEVSRNTKVVEDEFDENGRPRVKILFVHPMDWSTKANHLFEIHWRNFEEAEDDAAEELTLRSPTGQVFERPRIIYVLQHKDYWPGTDSDPDALTRRELRLKALRENNRRPYGGSPDYKEVILGKPYNKDTDYFNPDLPGAKFLREYLPKSFRKFKEKEMELQSSGYKRPFESSAEPVPSKKKCRCQAYIVELEAQVTQLKEKNEDLQKKLGFKSTISLVSDRLEGANSVPAAADLC